MLFLLYFLVSGGWVIIEFKLTTITCCQCQPLQYVMFATQLHAMFPTRFPTLSDATPTSQMNEAATEGEICQFVMQSYRSFEQALYENVFEHLPATPRLEGEGEPSTDIAWGHPVGAELLKGSNPHFIASLTQEPGAGLCSSRILDMMTVVLAAHSRQFQQLEHAADR